MKPKLLFMALIAICQHASAQNTSPYWSLAGNSTATTSSKLGTTNSIPLRLMTKNLERVRIDSNGRVSIGTTGAFGKLTVLNTSSIPGTPWKTTTPVLSAFGENTSGTADFVLSMASNTSNARSVLFGKRARGTLATPTVVKQGDYIMSLYTGAYDGSKFQNPANIDFIVDTTTGLGKIPTKLSFVTGTSASTKKERMRIGSNGDIVLNGDQAEFRSIGGKRIISMDENHFRMTSTKQVDEYGEGTFADSANWRVRNFTIKSGESTPTNNGALLNVVAEGPAGANIEGEDVGLFASGYIGTGIVAAGNSVGIKATSGNLGMSVEGSERGMEVRSSFGSAIYAEAGEERTAVIANGWWLGVLADGVNGIRAVAGGSDVFSDDDDDLYGVYGENKSVGPGIHGFGNGGVGVKGTSVKSYGVFGSTGNTSSYAGYFTGKVYASSGLYTASDRELKQNVKDLTSATNIIGKLKPKSYEYKQDGSYKLMNLPQGRHFGLIAQEVEEVLPNLVQASEYNTGLARKAADVDSLGRRVPSTEQRLPNEKIEFKAVNYTELIPIMVKAMQEQQQENTELREVIGKQQQQLDELKAMMNKLVQGSGAVSLTNASLGIATPNPASGSAMVSFSLPEGSRTAHIVVTDIKGSIIKQVNISGKGNGRIQLNTAPLAAGTYTYSLHVDGSKVDSKQLLVYR